MEMQEEFDMNIPHCDLATGKIYGCKKNSFKWWHEKGHFEFNKLEFSSALKLFQYYSQSAWMFFITLSVLNIYWLFAAFPSLLFYIFVDVYEERWCNNYAYLKIRERSILTQK